ncbi:DUF2846 domain-containing protein [Erythrobacter sp. F6033]|uniref:DUF2846 domain-containing protein n=1 Tax=Erythrobacter sp. F6033 TaxID=2926401 RepID=UPI001FF1FCEE|nr:DUF2846 domain-containing protein [Erythrobacter sp. F6033]MCK0128762.1 DUF2846 domain-containing protein [Erythrobacter sp. F6033]
MNNATRNTILIAAAIVVGLVLGFQFPMLGLLLIIPVIAFVAIVFLRNKGGADADESLAAEARKFTASEGKAAIYVMRKGFVAGQQGMNVTIDGGQTTQFRTGRFAKAEVEPGEHTITAQMASQTKGTAATHTVSLAAGECVLLDVKLSVGALQGSLSYEETRNTAEARGKLAGLKLVLWSEPEA